MIKLEKPIYDQKKIIDECVKNMNTEEDSPKIRILSSINTIVKKSGEYDAKAQAGQLSELEEHDVVEGGATKKDMKILYESKFAKEKQGGRKYYDKIKFLAPYGRCPLCGQREVRTLDHYLPKSKYPAYAVTPYNLIPSCSDCNKDKSASDFTSREKETIHPYYDDFSDEVWIKARVIEEEPITFEFFVEKPESWDDIKFKRAQLHFKEFGLNALYKPYACETFTGCLPRLLKLCNKSGKEAAREYVKESVDEAREIRLNTWQAAMYEALLYCNWFWDDYLKESST